MSHQIKKEVERLALLLDSLFLIPNNKIWVHTTL